MSLARAFSTTPRQLVRGTMGSRFTNGVSSSGSAPGPYTLAALNKWSIQPSQLPATDAISAIHIYDFDNTLFQTPLPNPKLWNPNTLGKLGNTDVFVNGGWWHDSRILAATGEGVEREEARAWNGWWNEKVVELVQLSMKQKDALTVLLTGRSVKGFSELVPRILKSKGLQFDMIGLKPVAGPNGESFSSTMLFKQAFLAAIMETYANATEIRIYEDRIRHVQGFRDFMAEYNKRKSGGFGGPPSRRPITAEVIHVADISTNLDPVVEVAEIQHLINEHNAIVGTKKQDRLAIRKTVFFTSYMISPEDTKRLMTLVAPHLPDASLKYHGNAILITAKPCTKQILDKIGGMHAKMKWGVTGIGSFDNSIWAVSVAPIPPSAPYHTDQSTPNVVIATRHNARPSDVSKIQTWQPIPPEKVFAFDTEVNEKVMLRIEPQWVPDNYNDGFGQNKNKRKFGDDDNRRSNNNMNTNGNGSRGFHTSNFQGRGGSRGGSRGGGVHGRGNRGNARGRGGGRGGRGGYRSLDDVGTREGQGGYGASPVSYDDNFPALGTHQAPIVPPPQFAQQVYSQQPGQWQAPNNSQGGYSAGGLDLQKFY
ncbi:hypothetical protein F5Y18DRAFT_406172 [Xylariaceae sp. FL1019]|nr:hypothetical protein F5Y18DRAFT_406172 [Xylariaceae sp. FL1019]